MNIVQTSVPRSHADVVIMGGGLAGLTLALQLRQRFAQLEIVVLERMRHPVREAAHKVGESSVEIAAHYFDTVLGLREHLTARDIATDIHYPILDCHQAGWSALPQRCAPGGVAVAEASVPCLLTIPCFPGMTDDEVDTVCKALSSWTA